MTAEVSTTSDQPPSNPPDSPEQSNSDLQPLLSSCFSEAVRILTQEEADGSQVEQARATMLQVKTALQEKLQAIDAQDAPFATKQEAQTKGAELLAMIDSTLYRSEHGLGSRSSQLFRLQRLFETLDRPESSAQIATALDHISKQPDMAEYAAVLSEHYHTLTDLLEEMSEGTPRPTANVLEATRQAFSLSESLSFLGRDELVQRADAAKRTASLLALLLPVAQQQGRIKVELTNLRRSLSGENTGGSELQPPVAMPSYYENAVRFVAEKIPKMLLEQVATHFRHSSNQEVSVLLEREFDLSLNDVLAISEERAQEILTQAQSRFEELNSQLSPAQAAFDAIQNQQRALDNPHPRKLIPGLQSKKRNKVAEKLREAERNLNNLHTARKAWQALIAFFKNQQGGYSEAQAVKASIAEIEKELAPVISTLNLAATSASK